MIAKHKIVSIRRSITYFVLGFTAFVIFSSAYYKSLWMDDLATVYRSLTSSYLDFFLSWEYSTNLPLYFFLNKLYMSLVPHTEFMLRLPSILSSVGIIILLTSFAKKIDPNKENWVFLLLSSIICFWDPFLYFSTEVRCYSFLLLCLFGYLRCLLDIFDSTSKKRAFIMLSILAIASSAMHLYGSLFVFVTMVGCFFVKSINRKKLLLAYSPIIAIGTVLSPKIVSSFFSNNSFWIDRLTVHSFFNEISYSFSEKHFLITLVIFIAPITSMFYSLYKKAKKKPLGVYERFVAFCMVSYFLMIAILVIKSIVGTPIFFRRYLAVLMPIVIVSVPYAFKNLFEKVAKHNIVALFVIIFLTLSFSCADSKYFVSNVATNDIKGAFSYSNAMIDLEKHRKEKREVYIISYNPEFLGYYFHTLHVDKFNKICTFDYLYKNDQEFLKPLGDLNDKKLFIIYEKNYLERLKTFFKEKTLLIKDFNGIIVLLVN